MPLALPILDDAPQRPVYAQGPRSLDAVRLLRISVTDRCNFRCVYCMPDRGPEWMTPRQSDLLTPAEFHAVAAAALRPDPHTRGVTSLKLTGGEPTLRPDIIEIVQRLASLEPHDLSLTTNGSQLTRLARPLRNAGLHRLTISLDTLRADRFAAITRGADLRAVLDGIAAATDAGFERLKINVVIIRGWNDDELADLAALTLDRPWTVRFIEYMPLGESAFTIPGVDPADMTLDNAIVRERIAAAHRAPLEPLARDTEPGVGPAQLWRLPRARGRLGFISAMSRPFCETCNRLRLTSVGELRSCLFDGGEVNLLPALRPAPDHNRIVERMRRCVALKPTTHSPRGNRAMSQIGG